MPYNSVVYGGAETVAVFDVNEESSILALAACGEDMLLLARTEGGALYLELYDFEGPSESVSPVKARLYPSGMPMV